LPHSRTGTSASDALYALAFGAARSVVVVGTAKNAGKTTTFNALCEVARERGVRIGVTSLGRDGEPYDAVDGAPKPRVRLAPGTIATIPADLVAASAPLATLERGAESALGRVLFVRALDEVTCEIGGPPSARAMRATIARLQALVDGPVLVDGAIDRIAPLAGGDDAVIVATGAVSGETIDAVAAVAAETAARLRIPPHDAHERDERRVVRIAGAIDGREAEALLARAAGATVVVRDPTRIAVRGERFARLMRAVDVRCERPIRLVALTTSPVAGDVRLPARELVEAVARATALPVFDVVADVGA